MSEVKRGDRRETTAADDATVVAPRFDEREEATARPVVPLSPPSTTGRRGAGGFSLRANSRQLLLAWAVIATLAAGGVAVYKSAHTSESQQVAPQSATENTASGAVAATPETTRRAVPVAPVRAAKMDEARASSPSWEVPEWSDRGEAKRDEPDEEEPDERARKEEKRRRKEEKKQREEAEKETERAIKEARKRAERRRERQKDDGRKARLIGVLTRQD
jgi:hypothetical protein